MVRPEVSWATGGKLSIFVEDSGSVTGTELHPHLCRSMWMTPQDATEDSFLTIERKEEGRNRALASNVDEQYRGAKTRHDRMRQGRECHLCLKRPTAAT